MLVNMNKLTTLPKRDVVLANPLIQASFKSRSVPQMRLFYLALSQIKATDELDHNREFMVTVDDYAGKVLTGNQAKNNCYRDLRKAAKQLHRTIITVPYTPDGRTPLNGEEKDISVMSQCIYIKGEACIKLKFTEPILPYISALTGNFTIVGMRYLFSLFSLYGTRFYALFLSTLSRNRKIKDELEISIEWIRGNFQLGKSYDRYSNLKDKVIDQAVKDINENTNMVVSYEALKTGNKVTDLKFSFALTDLTPEEVKQLTEGVALDAVKDLNTNITKQVEATNRKGKLTWDEFVVKNARPVESWGEARKRLSPLYQEYLKQFELPLGQPAKSAPNSADAVEQAQDQADEDYATFEQNLADYDPAELAKQIQDEIKEKEAERLELLRGKPVKPVLGVLGLNWFAWKREMDNYNRYELPEWNAYWKRFGEPIIKELKTLNNRLERVKPYLVDTNKV